jgi:hypothetical protein
MPTSRRGRNKRLAMVSALPVSIYAPLRCFRLYQLFMSIGLGSVISPLVCQSIIATGVPWYRFYYGSLVLSVSNIVFLYIIFKPTFGERDREHQKALNRSRRRNLLRSGRPSLAREYSYSAASESKTTLSLGDAKPRSSEF